MNKEQLEAVASDAVSKLSEKIGSGAQIIVMVMDVLNPEAPYMIERHGSPLGLIWLLRVGSRIVEDKILPKPTIDRED
jgi:hypothetical protein